MPTLFFLATKAHAKCFGVAGNGVTHTLVFTYQSNMSANYITWWRNVLIGGANGRNKGGLLIQKFS